MSSSNSKNGLVPTPRQAITPVAPQRPQAAAQPSDHIIAQIPDLAPAAAVATKRRFPSGRIISQALSMKLVFGVGAALVVGAVLPFAFNKVSHPKPVQELPAWNGQAVQASATQNTAETVAPAWTAAPAKQTTVVVPPQPASSSITPPPPAIGDYRPNTMRGPSWTPPQSVAGASQSQQPGYPNQAAPRGNPLPGRSDNPAVLEADRRNDPVARFNDDSRYADPRLVAPPARPVAPSTATAPNRDYRYDTPRNGDPRYSDPRNGDPRYDDPRYNTGAPQGNQQMPAGGYGYGPSNYRGQPSTDPGVAHFDGTINNPPVRTNP